MSGHGASLGADDRLAAPFGVQHHDLCCDNAAASLAGPTSHYVS